ncbi:MAG TPA: hypothetical protein VKD22_14735 [Ramlibacter sp.]|nr:hypothetical protein [Ramlibacter sp.]
MIPYQTDPSLHDHEPAPVLLDDGFSPPTGDARGSDARGEEPALAEPPAPDVRD